MDISPYYEKVPGGTSGLAEGPYLDEQDAVDLGPDEGDGAGRDFPRKSTYPYGPQNSTNPFSGNTN